MYSDEQIKSAFAKSVYFHAVGGPLTHNAGCLIEGAMDLGIPVKMGAPNITSRPVSMPLKGRDLSPYVSPPYAGFSGYIIDISHTNNFVPFDGAQDGRVSYLNQSDISIFCRIPDEHLLFVAHESHIASKGGTRRPIAFGLSNSLISSTESRPDFPKRRPVVLRNFRATLSQSVRALLDMSFIPRLEKHLDIDHTDYEPNAYINAMQNSQICLAYGGDFYTPITSNPWFTTNDPDLAKMHHFERFDAPALVQRWDSFRLWESFAAGCLTVHLDFEKYGFALPKVPKAWKHYVPIDLDNITDSVTELMDRQNEWGDIAAKGREWAIKHYAPKPTAARVLSEMMTHAERAL